MDPRGRKVCNLVWMDIFFSCKHILYRSFQILMNLYYNVNHVYIGVFLKHWGVWSLDSLDRATLKNQCLQARWIREKIKNQNASPLKKWMWPNPCCDWNLIQISEYYLFRLTCSTHDRSWPETNSKQQSSPHRFQHPTKGEQRQSY